MTHLADYFAPAHYQLELELNKKEQTFTGVVEIHGKKIGRPTKRLTFHQKDLRINSAKIIKHDKKHGVIEIPITRIVQHAGYDEVRLHSNELLYPGEYHVEISFSGTITTQMNGVYPCNFTHNKKKKQLLATQFESHHAREVFPCIDEPVAKATFQLTTKTEPGETVLSNTAIEEQQQVDGKLITKFEKTPIMSTYLLAFATGELGHKETKTTTGVAVRAYATPDNVKFVDFALEVAKSCLEFYDEYFGIPYPLEKCDMIALPDFASGAMENWGLITYREQTLLVDPEHTTMTTKQYVAMVVAHELAHQWFGNLVTMKWWTDLWLNEGFASWIEYLAVDNLFPDWQMWTQFVATEQQQAMRLDSLIETHPVEVPIKHPDEIRTIFDAISYSKGASLIHMLHGYLGPETFQAGLRTYLHRHSYANTITTDLWQALEDSSDQPVRSFMHDWTTHSGFPLVRTTVENNQISITQERFCTDPSTAAAASTVWPIPLLLSENIDNDLLTKSTKKIKLTTNQPIKLNHGQTGFYRTLYNSSHLDLLGHQITKGKLAELDRIGVASDVLEGAKYGYCDSVDTVAFLDNFNDEESYAVWEVISTWLGSLRLVMNDEKLREAMKPFTRQLIAKQLERLGWDESSSDSYFDKLLRPTIINMAAGADEDWVVKKCEELFAKIHDVDEVRPSLRQGALTKNVKRGLVHPDLRGAVFGTVARRGDQDTFQKLVNLHNSSHLSEEKTTLAAAITGFRQPELIDQSLKLIKSSDVRLQDVSYWIAYSFLNRHARDHTWQWLKDNWDWLENNLGSDLSFYRMPLYIARVFTGEDFKESYQEFFKPKLRPGIERPYKQGLEMLTWQTRWQSSSHQALTHHFTAKHQETT